MASIYKRGRIWWIAYKDATGKRVCRSLKTTSRAQAARIRKQYQLEEQHRALAGRGSLVMRLSAFTAMYLRQRQGVVAPSTLRRDRQALESLARSVGDPPLDAIRPADVAQWRAEVLNTRRPATANCLLRHVKAALRTAVTQGIIQVSPAAALRPARETTRPPRILTRDEARRLLDGLPPAWSELVRAALYTGARSGELCRLNVEDLDLERMLITIRSTNEAPTKSGRFRVVPLPRDSREFFQGLARRGPGPLLRTPRGLRWRVDRISSRFPGWAGQCGVRCTFHDLRRTYGAWLVMSGADLVTVQENLGHSSIAVTVKHYAHMLLDHRAAQVDKLTI